MDQTWPVSVKGILTRDSRVLVMMNERDEWELPGGHVEAGESPTDALAREFLEETGLTVRPTEMVSAAFYQPLAEKGSVLLLFYRVEAADGPLSVERSPEHSAVLWADPHRLPDNLPSVYRDVIAVPANLARRVGEDLLRRLRQSGKGRVEHLAVEESVTPWVMHSETSKPRVAGPAWAEDATRGGALAALHAAFRDGRTDPVTVIEQRLQRAQKWQQRTPLFIAIDADAARVEARAAQERYRQRTPLSMLDGAPIGLKDLIDLKGWPTTAASRVGRQRVADRDAVVAARLRDAGANLALGKLNLHEFAYGPTGDSSYYGAVGNPYDLQRLAGGSSSGSAVAVAVGVVEAALGTDTGGSVRIPAAFTGITGFKPSLGRVATDGVVPLSWSLDHVGPMARTVADVVALLAIIAPGNAMPQPRRRVVLYWPDDPLVHCYEPGLDQYIEQAVYRIAEGLGATLKRGALPQLDRIWLAQSIIIGTEALTYHWNQLTTQRQDYQPDVADRLERGGAHLAVEYCQALRFRRQAMGQIDRLMESVDALILPTVPILAPPLSVRTVLNPKGEPEDIRAVLTRFTAPFNFLGLPALSLPWGLMNGLPVGLQLVGRRQGDEALLQLGLAIQHKFPESIPKPPDVG